MSAMLAADHRDHAIRLLDRVRAEYEQKRRIAERFAQHAASVNERDVSEHFAKAASQWAEAIDVLAVAIQKEQGR